jgi:Na+-translocating ferredoxin:NAD+ oxidoreductase RnfG subunit
MTVKSSILTLAVFSLLAGCVTPQADIPLEQKLAGKNRQERQQILLEVCHAEARHRVVRVQYAHGYHENPQAALRLHEICDAMGKEMGVTKG